VVSDSFKDDKSIYIKSAGCYRAFENKRFYKWLKRLKKIKNGRQTKLEMVNEGERKILSKKEGKERRQKTRNHVDCQED